MIALRRRGVPAAGSDSGLCPETRFSHFQGQTTPAAGWPLLGGKKMNYKLELENIHNRIKNMNNEELYKYLTQLSYLYHIASIERDNRLIDKGLYDDN